MAQITSREELQEWLKDKPADWAQVVAARAALTSLPRILTGEKSDEWLNTYILDVFQCALVAWTNSNLSILKFNLSIDQKNDPFFIYGAFHDTVNYNEIETVSTYEIANAAFEAIVLSAGLIDTGPDDIYKRTSSVILAANAADEDVWRQVSADCEWLEKLRSVSDLSRCKLWPELQPEMWGKQWKFAITRLLNLDPTYQVWIDWYNRRIEGHDAAFDIPGDTDRTEDKAILARLADATNEDFWDKGATYVNTTLQSWIDEAREQAAIDYVASGTPLKLGSDAELAARPELTSRLASVEDALAALKDQLASLTQTGHGGIGHNQPENATSLRDDEIITLKQQVKELETLVTGAKAALTQPEPDIGELVQLVPKLNRWGRMMQAVEDVTSPKVREGLETWAGPAALGAVGYLASTTIPNALAAFSHYFYTYWIPLLIG